MMRVALMARVSTARQGAADRMSLPAQLAYMRERCTREGWEIVAEYEAPGERAWVGTLSKRPVLARAVVDAEAHLFDLLMVHEGGRFARKVSLHIEIEERLERAGVRLLEATEPLFDEVTPELWMFGINKAAMQEYWSRKVSQHVRKGYSEMHRQGLPTGPIPFGYRRDPGTKVPVPDPAEAPAVRDAFEAYAAGLRGPTEIAADWSARGLRPHSQVGNEGWYASTVSALLRNPFYAGYVRHGGDRALGQHEPLISEELYARAQGAIHTRARGVQQPTLLRGIARCALCGSSMWAAGTKRLPTGERTYYYRDGHPSRGPSCPQRGRLVRADRIDGQVEAVLQAMGSDAAWLDHVRRSGARSPSSRRTERAEVERRRQRITRAFLTPGSGLDEREYMRLLREVDAALASLPASSDELGAAVLRMRSWSEVWSRATPRWRNEVARTLLQSAAIDVATATVSLEPAPEFAPLFGLRAAFVQPTVNQAQLLTAQPRLYLPSELVA